MKKASIFGPLASVLFSLTAYAPGPNEMVNSENLEGKVAGFWQGLSHGFIALFTFLVSLFNDNVGVYEVHNNGRWYDFGFILGVMIFFGGRGGGGIRAYSRKREQVLLNDHTGNAAYLCKKFATKIAMPPDDSGMLERGDMFWNRKKGNILIRMMTPIPFRFGKSDRCKPDLTIEAGYDLSEQGLNAKVLDILEHSKGSIGILTAGGDPSAGSGQALFCGDLLKNTSKPGLNSIMDDLAAANASLEKLKSLGINTVYPGHGKPFPWLQLSSLG